MNMPIDIPQDPKTKAPLVEVASKTVSEEEVDDFLDDCAFKGRWDDLKLSLRYPHVRARLASHIWNMQDQAMGEGHSDLLCEALPSRLDAATAKEALNYPFQTKAWDLTAKMLALGARFSDLQFTHACSEFSEKPDAYYRKVIQWSIRHQMVSWQSTLGFNAFDDWEQLIARADRDSNPALYLVASGIMTAKQKRQIIKSSHTEERVLLIVKNMDLPKQWQNSIPEPFQAAVLAYDLGV